MKHHIRKRVLDFMLFFFFWNIVQRITGKVLRTSGNEVLLSCTSWLRFPAILGIAGYTAYIIHEKSYTTFFAKPTERNHKGYKGYFPHTDQGTVLVYWFEFILNTYKVQNGWLNVRCADYIYLYCLFCLGFAGVVCCCCCFSFCKY